MKNYWYRSSPCNLQTKEKSAFFGKEKDSTFFNDSETSTAQSFFNKPQIQPKLTIGQPNDKYEQEADATADKVVRRLSNGANSFSSNGDQGVLQAKCASCEQEVKLQTKEEPLAQGITPIQRKSIFESNEEPAGDLTNDVQTKSDQSKTATPSNLEGNLNTTKGKGASLSKDTQTSMGSAFGSDFSQVKVHTDGQAVNMNNQLQAQAFTHGQDIYFNQGKYDEGSTKGKRLLAHELTHVVQQKELKNKIQKQSEFNFNNLENRPTDLDCPLPTDRPSGIRHILYERGSSVLSNDGYSRVMDIVLNFSPNQQIRIDGFASSEGNPEFNWRLSCERVKSVLHVLQHPFGAIPIPRENVRIYAHGTTDAFSDDLLPPNRTAVISLISNPVHEEGARILRDITAEEVFRTIRWQSDPVGRYTSTPHGRPYIIANDEPSIHFHKYVSSSFRGGPAIIDMVHFLVVGNMGELVGAILEDLQVFENPTSAQDPQDYYSNYLGSYYFQNYYNPNHNNLSDSLRAFFNNFDSIPPRLPAGGMPNVPFQVRERLNRHGSEAISSEQFIGYVQRLESWLRSVPPR